MKPVIFHVGAGGEFRPVELTFATVTEVRRVRSWRKITPATNAGEFAALAAKRWFYYKREDATISSIEDLRAAMLRNDRAEVAFLLVASAEWAKRYRFLALAYCRRTWCHHLVLDFLAVRPGLTFANLPVSGIGTGILASLAGMANSLGMEVMWGEADRKLSALLSKSVALPHRPRFVCPAARKNSAHSRAIPGKDETATCREGIPEALSIT
jgi:hypothetical protein